jgi:hypothetical protein
VYITKMDSKSADVLQFTIVTVPGTSNWYSIADASCCHDAGGRSVSSAGQRTAKAFRAGQTSGKAGDECIPHRDYIPHHSRRVA